MCALLALSAGRQDAAAVERGLDWLERTRQPDGGWGAQPELRTSSWVTAPAVLALARLGTLGREDPAIEWLLRQRGRETSFLVRLRQALLGVRPDYETDYSGWPWFPGTSAWVPPTCWGILALRRVQRLFPDPEIEARLESGVQFLLSRMCHDGGWNQGSARALGYEAGSYPETTGLALLALQGRDFPRRQQAIARAREHYRHCRSVRGRSWLNLGLLAQGQSLPEEAADPSLRCWDTVETSLSVIARAAAAGSNVFLE